MLESSVRLFDKLPAWTFTHSSASAVLVMVGMPHSLITEVPTVS
jgi:hypothetical protein